MSSSHTRYRREDILDLKNPENLSFEVVNAGILEAISKAGCVQQAINGLSKKTRVVVELVSVNATFIAISGLLISKDYHQTSLPSPELITTNEGHYYPACCTLHAVHELPFTQHMEAL